MPSAEYPLIILDGGCLLCCRSARWIIRRDPGGRFRFAANDAEPVRQLLKHHGVSSVQSVVLIQDGSALTKSDAVAAILLQLRGWRWAGALLKQVPKSLRDWGYDFMAKRRSRWFGRCDVSASADPLIRERFIRISAK